MLIGGFCLHALNGQKKNLGFMPAQQSSVEAKIKILEAKLETFENKLETSESERATCSPDRFNALDIKIGGMCQRIAATQTELTRLRGQQGTGELNYLLSTLLGEPLAMFDYQRIISEIVF
jgi:predicted  nucleic acid-binding Zn-ribbon protein